MMKIRPLVLAALFAASPVLGALAQQTTSPSIGADNAKEATDIKDGAGKQSGAAGTTAVHGPDSSVASDRAGAADAKTDSSATGRGSK